MFFYLSKILSLLINPFNWILFFLIYALLSKQPILKNKSLKVSVFLLLFFTNNFIFLEFARLWEEGDKKIEDVSHYKVGVVLGGMAEYNNDLNRLSIRRGGDRIWQAINLYHLGKIDKILISGANGFVFDEGLQEALQFKKVLIENKINTNDILIEVKSKNTYQNAIESKIVLDHLNLSDSILLITSATHMKRSKACFSKAGFTNISTFSTDHFTGDERGYTVDQLFLPNVSVLTDWKKLIHEWVGYGTYKIMGYI